MNWKPIRKLVVGFATSSIVYAAHRWLHLDLGSEGVAEAVTVAVGYAAAYAVRDPRVAHAVYVLDHSAIAGDLEDMMDRAFPGLLSEADKRP